MHVHATPQPLQHAAAGAVDAAYVPQAKAVPKAKKGKDKRRRRRRAAAGTTTGRAKSRAGGAASAKSTRGRRNSRRAEL